jgi:hypothetical protein
MILKNNNECKGKLLVGWINKRLREKWRRYWEAKRNKIYNIHVQR